MVCAGARYHASLVDRVLAIVGNRPVLASQVEEEIFSRESQGAKLPTDPEGIEAVRQQVVGSIIDEELLVQQAQRDTAIKVTDEEIASGVEEQVRKVRGNFTSEVDYRAELQKAGFQTPEEYRRWLSDQQRRAAFQNRLIEKLRGEGKLKPVLADREGDEAVLRRADGPASAPGRQRSRSGRSSSLPSHRPRPRRAPRPRLTRSCSSSAGGPTSPPRRAASPRTRGRRSRAAR